MQQVLQILEEDHLRKPGRALKLRRIIALRLEGFFPIFFSVPQSGPILTS